VTLILSTGEGNPSERLTPLCASVLPSGCEKEILVLFQRKTTGGRIAHLLMDRRDAHNLGMGLIEASRL